MAASRRSKSPMYRVILCVAVAALCVLLGSEPAFAQETPAPTPADTPAPTTVTPTETPVPTTVTTTIAGSNCVSEGVPPGTVLMYTNGTYNQTFTVETDFTLSNFCQSSTVNASDCWKCMRGSTWTATPFPSGFGYASLAKLVSGSFGYANFAQNLHCGVHNSIHNAAGSTMGTLSTSADPIFYNHQYVYLLGTESSLLLFGRLSFYLLSLSFCMCNATIDLVHQMWYDCQVKRPMTETEKKNSVYGFATCSQSPSVASPSRLANTTQFWSSGTSRMRADDHPVLGAFFSPLPTEYWRYVSGSDLWDYSYTYEKDALLHLL